MYSFLKSYFFFMFLGITILLIYEALTLVRHKTQYDMGHNDTAFLEKLKNNTVGIQLLINWLRYIFKYILFYL